MSRFEKIAILGAGAIGTYYGARLARSGCDVRFFLRSDLQHVQTHGLRIREKSDEWTVPAVKAFGRTREIGVVDVVFVTLKATANAALSELLPPLIGPETLVVTLQNGLGNEELLAELVGAERVLGGLCFIASTRTAPGEVTCYHPGSITLGEFARPATERTQALAEVLIAAGIQVRVVDSLAEARWRKLVWNVPFNGLAIAAGGITTDLILQSPALAGEVRALMDEVANAARTLSYAVSEAFIQQQIDVTLPMGPYQPSSLVDYLAKREVEVEPIWGEPLRRAQAAGLAMPRLSLLYALLQRLTK